MPPAAADFEKLGVFYLGRGYDLAAKARTDELVLYDARDLVTHAVCVGMTGSGKTGLCVGLLEEAAIDGVPAIVIDPKGDLANLLLTFPGLAPADFRPWVNEDDARRKGLSPDEFAAKQAELWRTGLAEWGQDGDRIRRLRDAADFSVYTPGSTAGIPVSILKSFAAPRAEVIEDGEQFRERVGTTATSLLGLMGVEADPIQSREHILLSTILAEAWRAGRDLDLAQLIAQIQSPPVQRVGVMELESFFPAKDRFALAMRLNNLLAAPGFAAWLEGAPLDVGQLLWNAAGKPRVAIFSVAHLGDAERMFFVSLLLTAVLAWTRQQPGTTSLRAILYMDEVFGYLPPSANPPSKPPLLALLKQARAFGVGVVLATQNPVDLDYKALSNAGTWFVGRLQTDRDKQRLLDGLEGAAAGGGRFDRAKMERTLAGLGQRVFLMNNVHEDAPIVFETRWAMSYLRGPLTRAQIKQLMDGRSGADHAPAPASPPPTLAPPGTSTPPAMSAATPAPAATARPVLDPQVPQGFLPVRSPRPDGAALAYVPMLYGSGTVYYADVKHDVDLEEPFRLLAPIGEGVAAVDWSAATPVAVADLQREPPAGSDARFLPVPAAATRPASYAAWGKRLADAVYRDRTLTLWRHPTLKLTSRPGEDERLFRIRLQQAAHERRDQDLDKLRKKYAPKLASLQDRVRRAEQAESREREQASASKWNTAISVGATVLGAVLGRRSVGRATTAARGASRSYKEQQDVARAAETVAAVRGQLEALQREFDADAADLSRAADARGAELEQVAVRPKKSNVTVTAVALAWAPHWQSGNALMPAY